jgi:DNA invertase Pin-like site-specific DNA recombinase
MAAAQPSTLSTVPQPRVAIYARVSTLNNQDPEMQLREVREYCEHRGLVVTEEYVDRISGSKESRPHLNRLMEDAQRRRFDIVVVWKLDRWGRSLKHLVNSLAQLESLGVAFISLRDNLDLTTPSGRLMFHVIGAMAQFERSLIQERVRAGLRNACAKGQRLGRPRLAINTAKMEKLRAEGMQWKQIAGEMGISQATLFRAAVAL